METLEMVTGKDFLVAGTVVTGLAKLAGQEMGRCKHHGGTPSSRNGEGSSNTTAGDGYDRYTRTFNTVNRIFALSAVAATPFINFALFDSHHAHPVRSMFSL
jgi:hypothetical protein